MDVCGKMGYKETWGLIRVNFIPVRCSLLMGALEAGKPRGSLLASSSAAAPQLDWLPRPHHCDLSLYTSSQHTPSLSLAFLVSIFDLFLQALSRHPCPLQAQGRDSEIELSFSLLMDPATCCSEFGQLTGQEEAAATGSLTLAGQ